MVRPFKKKGMEEGGGDLFGEEDLQALDASEPPLDLRDEVQEEGLHLLLLLLPR